MVILAVAMDADKEKIEAMNKGGGDKKKGNRMAWQGAADQYAHGFMHDYHYGMDDESGHDMLTIQQRGVQGGWATQMRFANGGQAQQFAQRFENAALATAGNRRVAGYTAMMDGNGEPQMYASEPDEDGELEDKQIFYADMGGRRMAMVQGKDGQAETLDGNHPDFHRLGELAKQAAMDATYTQNGTQLGQGDVQARVQKFFHHAGLQTEDWREDGESVRIDLPQMNQRTQLVLSGNRDWRILRAQANGAATVAEGRLDSTRMHELDEKMTDLYHNNPEALRQMHLYYSSGDAYTAARRDKEDPEDELMEYQQYKREITNMHKHKPQGGRQMTPEDELRQGPRPFGMM